jgi:anti-anti-sigma factor
LSSPLDRSAGPLLDVVVEDFDGTRMVSPDGEVDASTAQWLARALHDGVANGHEKLVLNLAPTTFIDSTGIATVLGAVEEARRAGVSLSVVPGPPPVHRVFELCGLVDVVPFRAADGRNDGTQPT